MRAKRAWLRSAVHREVIEQQLRAEREARKLAEQDHPEVDEGSAKQRKKRWARMVRNAAKWHPPKRAQYKRPPQKDAKRRKAQKRRQRQRFIPSVRAKIAKAMSKAGQVPEFVLPCGDEAELQRFREEVTTGTTEAMRRAVRSKAQRAAARPKPKAKSKPGKNQRRRQKARADKTAADADDDSDADLRGTYWDQVARGELKPEGASSSSRATPAAAGAPPAEDTGHPAFSGESRPTPPAEVPGPPEVPPPWRQCWPKGPPDVPPPWRQKGRPARSPQRKGAGKAAPTTPDLSWKASSAEAKPGTQSKSARPRSPVVSGESRSRSPFPPRPKPTHPPPKSPSVKEEPSSSEDETWGGWKGGDRNPSTTGKGKKRPPGIAAVIGFRCGSRTWRRRSKRRCTKRGFRSLHRVDEFQ